MLITIHHTIFDGVSLMTFMSALLDAYVKASEGKEPVMVQQAADYHDFVKWEKELLESEAGKTHLSYWKKQLEGLRCRCLSFRRIIRDHRFKLAEGRRISACFLMN